MKVLFLGPSDSPLVGFLTSIGEEVLATAEPVDRAFVESGGFDFLVSYGYRHIVPPQVLDQFPDRAVNLHISLLPWNRGAHPNVWSFLEHTPKGVTIHHMDEGVDTGDIIVQRDVSFDGDDTLRSSYERLQDAIQELFVEHWEAIRSGRAGRRSQHGTGTFHRHAEIERIADLLTQGWDTPTRALEEADAR